MPTTFQVVSPWPFKERLLFIGDGGSGKSYSVLNMARFMPYAHFWINDTDVSFAYHRLLATEYQDVEARDQVTVLQSSDWDEFTKNMDEIKANGNPADDVLVVDNATFPWQWVQDHHVNAQYGTDIDIYLAGLRKEHPNDMKAYSKALSEGMQWPIINKKFNKGLYNVYHKWAGHAIMVAQGKTTKGEKDEELLSQFQVHGMMPAGQKDLSYVMATNILCMTRPGNRWAITTTKDRGRVKVERMEVESFARDYLVDVAKWDLERTTT